MTAAATATAAIVAAAPPPAPVSADTGALRITLFGPMQVLVRGEPLPPVRSRKILWLLALLALRAGRAVEREWLAGTLWPDVDQARAFDNLRPALSRLRDALGAEADRLHAPSRSTLLLDLSGADADVPAFDAAVGRGDPESLAAAVALYAGPLLEGVAEEWVVQDREAREQDCLRALHRLGEHAAGAGDHVQAAGHWRRAAGMDPLGEAARRGLMAALAATGDVNAALAVYREFAAALRASDPRAAPDQETESLYRRLRDDARRRAAATATSGGASSPTSVPQVAGYLPHAPTGLVGREDESQEVAAALRRSRLVTLTGPGGIGKTRLALATADEVVREFPDGVQLVALESLRPAGPEGNEGAEEAVSRQVAAAFGVREEAGRPVPDALAEHLRRRNLLLVLDNCEHVLEASAHLASRLLRECPGVRILATSRESLRVGGETIWVVPTLTTPEPDRLPERGGAALTRLLGGYDAVRLFVERAMAAHRGFAVTGGNARDVARLCSRLEGVPLAIELAAARAGVLTPAQTMEQLDARPLDALSSQQRDAAPRHRSLRSVLEWSVGLLPPPAREFLADMGVFRGGWTLEAARAVSLDHDALEMLSVLRDASLVNVADDGEGIRFSLLETVRQFAAEELDRAGRAAEVRRRHLAWCVTLAEAAEPHLQGPEQGAWLRRLDTEHDNLRAALDPGSADAGAGTAGPRLASALVHFWQAHGHFAEGRRHLERAASGATEPSARMKALKGAGLLAHRQGDYGAAGRLYEEALGIARQQEDGRATAVLLSNLASLERDRGGYAEAHARTEEVLSLRRAQGDRRGIALSLANLGNTALALYGPTAARSHYEESLSMFRELGDARAVQHLLVCLANANHFAGDLPAARALAEEAVTSAREAGAKPGCVGPLIVLGDVCLAQDDPEAARSYYEESLALARAVGMQGQAGYSLLGLGEAAHARGEPGQARRFYEEGRDLFRGLGERGGEASALLYLGRAAAAAGDPVSALSLYRDSAEILRSMGDQLRLAECLSGLAAVHIARGEPHRAVRLWAAAEGLREGGGARLSPKERDQSEHWLQQARSALGEDVFTVAWGEGFSMGWEQAVAYALGEDGGVPAAPP